MIKNVILLASLLVKLCYGERHLTLHTGNPNDSSGNSLTVHTNITDFQAFAPGIATVAKKICATGLWITYNEANYKGKAKPHPYQNTWDGEICLNVNRGSQTIGSARYVGPEADIESGQGLITLFSEIEFEGDVFRVDGPADAHLPFIPKSFLLTGGNKPWTLYTGINFNGTATCYEIESSDVSGSYQKVTQLTDDIKSVSKVCFN